MRDAESMLDQLMSAAPERIDESHVRDLLGLADAEVVAAFIDHLVRGGGAAGVALLDSLEERGRDIRALLDQAVEAIRAELIAGLSEPATARHDPQALAAAGRRLAAIDPNRAGIGGLRFQLELAMFAGTPARGVASVSAPPTRRPGEPEPGPTVARATAAPAPAKAPTRSAARVDPPASPPQAAAPAEPPATDDAPADSRATAATAPPDTGQGPEIAAVPATVARTSPAGGPREAALDELLAAWPAIVERLSAHPPTKPLIVSCRPVSVDGAVVTLGFPEEQAFLKDQAERRKPGIEAGIAAVIGHPVTVHCVVANVELPPAASDDLVAEARRIFAEELADVGEVS
jgi:DNA polymerase III subunit gamma/tau